MLDVKRAIKILSMDKGIKINELANRIGISPHSLSNWLFRPDSPRINKTEDLLKEFGCHLAIVDDETGEILFSGETKIREITDEEVQIFDHIVNTIKGANQETSDIRLGKSSSNGVSASISDTEIVRFKYSNQAKWIHFPNMPDKEPYYIETIKDIAKYNDLILANFYLALAGKALDRN